MRQRIIFTGLSFFFKTGSGTPIAIITNESPTIKGGLINLAEEREFSGIRLLDNFHLIRKIKKN